MNVYQCDSKSAEVEGCLVLDSAQSGPGISGRQRSVPGKVVMEASEAPEEARRRK